MPTGRTWHDRHLGPLFVLPATLMLVVVLIFPALITLKLSVTPEGKGGLALMLVHYRNAFRDPVLLQTFRNTFSFVTFSLLGHLLVGLGLALALNQALPGQTFFRLIALVPWIIPDVIAGIIFRWVFNPIHGSLNPLLRSIFPGFPAEFSWLSSPTLAFPSLIFANVWRGYPLMMVMLLAGLMAIPRELDEAGLVDGASRLQIFLRIICPIAVPGTVSTLLFAFLLAWQDLLWALCLVSIDEKRTVTLGVAFLVGEFVIQWPMLTAASLIGSLPTILLYLFLQRYYVEGLARGAVKG